MYRCRMPSSLWLAVVTWLLAVPTASARPQQSHPSNYAAAVALSDWLERQLDIKSALDSSPGGRVDCDSAAVSWTDSLDSQLRQRTADLSQAQWNYETNLTDYNSKQLEAAQTAVDDYFAAVLPTARSYLARPDSVCNTTTLRLLQRLVNYNIVPIANNPNTRIRINQLVNDMLETYSTAVITDATGRQLSLDPDLTELMESSRDWDRLVWAWQGWRNVTGRVIKRQYVELVELLNEAARDNGFANAGLSWQMTDFGETDIEEMMDGLYDDIRPFYEQLHAFVRRRLITAYPDRDIDPTGPIPAHLLGNMWAQTWDGIEGLLLPYPDVEPVNVTDALLKAGYSATRMFQLSEQFFTSIGLEPMTDDFWAKSMLVRPKDGRDVVCHGSAHDFYAESDFRIKMCTVVTASDLQTVHHEMGHIEYFMQYRHQPTLFREGANAAFHEAVGDTIALSVVTPEHLNAIQLISEDSSTHSHAYEQEINFLMSMALQKIAFLPFGLIVDKWRFEVFRGDVTPDQYNARWAALVRSYQGLEAPVPQTDDDFDPGCKYHVPANVPYSRYFLSFIGQFQFQAALCRAKGHRGPLNKCDIYQSTAAGNKLKSVLSSGSRLPWRDVMFQLTGQHDFRADAILSYFQPLIDWLETQNKGHPVGWTRHKLPSRHH